MSMSRSDYIEGRTFNLPDTGDRLDGDTIIKVCDLCEEAGLESDHSDEDCKEFSICCGSKLNEEYPGLCPNCGKHC